MCGMFARVTVSNEIGLPHFPEEIDRNDMSWQSKQGLDVYAGPYRITADGRLEQKQTSYRDKTADEKRREASKWGFDSWDEYVQCYEECDSMLVPDAVDWDADVDGYDDSPPTMSPTEKTIDEEWWADISYHGTFEFHQALRRDPVAFEEMEKSDGEIIERPTEHALDVFLEYEARFNKGDLTDLVFMGERGSTSDDPIGDALDKIEEWQEWRDDNAGR